MKHLIFIFMLVPNFLFGQCCSRSVSCAKAWDPENNICDCNAHCCDDYFFTNTNTAGPCLNYAGFRLVFADEFNAGTPH